MQVLCVSVVSIALLFSLFSYILLPAFWQTKIVNRTRQPFVICTLEMTQAGKYVFDQINDIKETGVQSENHRREKEALSSRQLSNDATSIDSAQRRQLQKDNAQLRVKVTELLKELEEVRNEREQLGQPPDVVTRLQAKQIAQHAERNRALEVA